MQWASKSSYFAFLAQNESLCLVLPVAIPQEFKDILEIFAGYYNISAKSELYN